MKTGTFLEVVHWFVVIQPQIEVDSHSIFASVVVLLLSSFGLALVPEKMTIWLDFEKSGVCQKPFLHDLVY